MYRPMECQHLFVKTFTLNGVCYTLREVLDFHGNEFVVRQTGTLFSISIVVDIQQYEYSSEKLGNGVGLKVRGQRL